jgi:radical SAM protein (TIGR01212 family)
MGDPERLRELYDQVLEDDEVVGLMVGTRPDCLQEPVMELLESYRQRTYFWLEVGIQSLDDSQLAWMRRGHDSRCTISALERAKKRGIRVCGHFIFGFPGERRDHGRRTAEFVNDMGIEGVKIHLLHVVEGTELQRRYLAGEVQLLQQEEYVGRVCDFLEWLSPGVIIHRLTGDGGAGLVAPAWSASKARVLQSIEEELASRDGWQGCLATPLKDETRG